MNLKKLLFIVMILLPMLAIAQKETNEVIGGNKLYRKEKFTEAEIAYRKALVKNIQSAEANYNLGNTLYKQGKFDEALKQYQASLPFIGLDKKKAAAIFHNIGNSLLSEKKIEESIKAYKMALKANPNDNDTRYNLAYAMALLKKEQDKNNKDKDNKKDQNKKNNDDKQDKENKKPQPKQQEPQMSKENAQQILNALQQDEKDTKDKADKARIKVVKRAEKDW